MNAKSGGPNDNASVLAELDGRMNADVAVAAAAQVSLRAPGAGTIDSAPGSAFGLALMQTGTSFVFAAVDDGLNVLDIWNGQN